MIEVLTPIWKRVLKRSAIGIEDNFFDLGGDQYWPLICLPKIEQVCGQQLPPAMIYHAPTIAALAAQLEQPTASPFPPLVLLKAGSEASPIFIAHGLGGSVIDFFQLVRHMECQQPIYGMQARGIDGVDEPFYRIEDLAQFYLDAIKEIQPHGPYFLIGYSLGGLVTLEMAQRLRHEHEQVALLVMLESYPYWDLFRGGKDYAFPHALRKTVSKLSRDSRYARHLSTYLRLPDAASMLRGMAAEASGIDLRPANRSRQPCSAPARVPTAH